VKLIEVLVEFVQKSAAVWGGRASLLDWAWGTAEKELLAVTKPQWSGDFGSKAEGSLLCAASDVLSVVPAGSSGGFSLMPINP